MKSLLLFSISALILLLTLAELSSVTIALTVHDVCVKSSFPQECEKILNSDPRSKTNDIFVIAHIAVDKAVISVTSTLNKIKSLLAQSRDPKQKQSLDICLDGFDFAKNRLGEANDFISTKDAEALNFVGANVDGAGVDCQASLGGSTLFKEITEARVVGDAIAAASNLFPRKL